MEKGDIARFAGRNTYLAPLIVEGMQDPLFAVQWTSESDESFRPYVAAVLELRKAQGLSPAVRQSLFHELCTRKRTDILAESAGRPIAASVIKALSRTTWWDFVRDDWRLLFSILAGEERGSPLGHVRQITPVLVRQWVSVPEGLRIPAILNVLGTLVVPPWRWDQLRRFLERASARVRADHLAIASTIATRGDFWDFYARCRGEYWRSFDLPPVLFTSRLIEPITSALDMQAEGLRMRNCLGNRVSRVLDGSHIYFRLRGDTEVDLELLREGDAMIPGAVLGVGNTSVSAKLAEELVPELRRLGEAISPVQHSERETQREAYLLGLRQRAREASSAEDVGEFAKALSSIRGRSRSWGNGAYAIFEPDRGGFVQFMSSPDGNEYLCEIQSHKYNRELDQTLDADFTDLVERAGFVWPIGKDNFLRWFNVSREGEIVALAEITLAILESAFGHRAGESVNVKIHVPAE